MTAQPNEQDRRAAVAFEANEHVRKMLEPWIVDPITNAAYARKRIRALAQAFAAHREQAERETAEACAAIADTCPDSHWGPWVAERIRARGKR